MSPRSRDCSVTQVPRPDRPAAGRGLRPEKIYGIDRFEGRCWLDWWANSSTLLGSVEVAVVITDADDGWEARGRLVSDEDRDAFAFLCDLDPVFMLRFEDESMVAVTAQPSDGHRRFGLTEYTGPVQRSVENRIAL